MAEGAGTRHYCFGCGDRNPHGLRLDFRFEDKRAVAEFQPRAEHQGYPGLVHGGVTAAALDEAMGWAMYALRVWAVTGKMEVKFRQPLPLDGKATVSAEVIRNRGRWLEVRGEVRSAEGKLMAESQGLFMRLPKEKMAELEKVFLEGESP
jgi:acyl-coenzyme A thioesterase PaaI-like protein